MRTIRLWHKDLIDVLPRQQLLGQWRECCAIAKSISEKGTPNHILVNKIMEYPQTHFHQYMLEIREEMENRGYKVNKSNTYYPHNIKLFEVSDDKLFSGWHNDRYLNQCLANLQEKRDCGGVTDEEWQKITDKFPEWK